MLEAKFLGGLFPSHPDYKPIIDAIREKYRLHEVFPHDEPIEEIYLGEKIVSINEFTQDIKNQIIENLETTFSKEFTEIYNSTKTICEIDVQKELEIISDEKKQNAEIFLNQKIKSAKTTFQILDTNIDQVTLTICNYLLLGDSPEAPTDWFGRVEKMGDGDEAIILVLANKMTDLDYLFAQIRQLHEKTFGKRHPKITKKSVDTTYYVQLMKRKDDKEFALDEFIRLNKFKMPSKRKIKQYAEVRNKIWQRLRKRLKKAEDILNAIA